MRPPHDPLSGTRYRMVSRLGMGSMGDVFLVEHIAMERRLVAKVLHARYAQSGEYLARLEREARALGKLQHPNIVAVSDFDFTESGRPFIIMEYLEGRTLDAELRPRGTLAPSEALAYTRQILSALAAAHSNGIVHRDVKPQNLFLHSRGGSARSIKVLDFGAARDTKEFASPAVGHTTNTGIVVGTPGYLSPEGADGQRVDLRADLYAVGLVLSVMLSGRLPPPPPRTGPRSAVTAFELELPADVSALFAPVIVKSLALDPAHRYQSASEFLAALPKR